MKIREWMSKSEIESECFEMIGRYNRREASNVDLYMLCYVDLLITPLRPDLQIAICREIVRG